MTVYSYELKIDGCEIYMSGFASAESAKKSVYLEAYKAGWHEIPELRKHWWQYWLATEHSDIDKWLLEQNAK